MRFAQYVAAGVIFTAISAVTPAETAKKSGGLVFVEAESFVNRGGWVVDQQSIDQMGSSYLLAHGLGRPVSDASTEIKLPAPGQYRLWVRTRDWVAPWGVKGSPGRFRVLLNHQPVKATFGTNGAKWAWQDGGVVTVKNQSITITLEDLTGFEGRCDAILLARNLTYQPPNDRKTLTALRRELLGFTQPTDAGQYDLVVVGGGIAGISSAISAARLGLSVALVQNRPVLGGNNSSEIRVHLQGLTNLNPYKNMGNLTSEIGPKGGGNAQPAYKYFDRRKLDLIRREKNIRLFLGIHVNEAVKNGQSIQAVIGQDIFTGKRWAFRGRYFADCTGDGTVGALASADFRMGRESKAETGESLAPQKTDKLTMGTSVQWYAREAHQPTTFPACPWALKFTEKTCFPTVHAEWNWETGMNKNQITEIEQIRDHAFRANYGNWAFVKNHPNAKIRRKFAKKELAWMAYIGGKRESRRLLGDVILREQDITSAKAFPDACVTTTWTIDLHYPNPTNSKNFPGQEFRSIAKHKRIKPYAIPYRCLYSRNVDNLFMAGRNISVTHVALGTIRVMRTGGMMGEVVGMAASVGKKHNASPREVYKTHWNEMKSLLKQGVPKGK